MKSSDPIYINQVIKNKQPNDFVNDPKYIYVYNKNGEHLDLSVCNNIIVKMKYNENSNLFINIEKASQNIIKNEQDKIAKENYENNKQLAISLKEALEKIEVIIYATGGNDGRMFGNVSSKEVVEELKKQHNLTIDKKKFISEVKISSFGVTILKNELFKDVIASIKVIVKEK